MVVQIKSGKRGNGKSFSFNLYRKRSTVECYGMQEKREGPHSGVLGFRSPEIPGSYVTNFAPHKALKLIA